MNLEDLRYPLGRFEVPSEVTPERVKRWIDEIEACPAALHRATAGRSREQLDTRYRPEGWTVRQVVHHLADSHLNSYVRFRWALTEDSPRIKAYHEERWAELPDAREGPIELSLDLLDGLHRRWVSLLRQLGPTEWVRDFEHPESGRTELGINIGIYAWHGRHHLAHITRLAEREGWD